jgi:NTP pyrophosphatase (non-canonical NTP hydrolase)
MELSEIQKAVDNWIKTTGVRYFNELTNTALLMEEVGEVARIMARQYGEHSFKKSDTEVNGRCFICAGLPGQSNRNRLN